MPDLQNRAVHRKREHRAHDRLRWYDAPATAATKQKAAPKSQSTNVIYVNNQEQRAK